MAMFRKTSGSILCPSCGRLTHASAAVCLVCGRRNPGMWGFAGPLRQIFRTWNFTNAVTVACVVLYIATLILDPASALRSRGLFDILAPSIRALWTFGASGAMPWQAGHWWTVLTAIYLHGSLPHVLFNVVFIRILAPEVEALYGPARLVIVYTVSGAAGFLLSSFLGVPFSVGAPGALFEPHGAVVAFAHRRGDVVSRQNRQESDLWARVRLSP